MKYTDCGANPTDELAAIALTDLALTDFILTDLDAVSNSKQAVLRYPRHLPTPPIPVFPRIISSESNSEIAASEPSIDASASLEMNSESSQGHPVYDRAAKTRLRKQEFAKAHQRALRQRLQHRIEVAQAKGDRVLLQQLEQEMQTLLSEQ